MNILSISQLQTQTLQNDFSKDLTTKPNDSEKSSFADFLHDAQKTRDVDNRVEENRNSDDETLAKNEELPREKIAGENQNEKKSENAAKSEKIARKESTENEEKNLAVKEPTEEKFEDNFIVVSLNQIQNARKTNDFAENTGTEETKIVLGEENAEIDDKMISWLMSSNKIDSDDEISNEDFAKMIDAAVEFIPGTESEGEKLENAQNLAVNDPEKFLRNITPSAEFEDFVRKTELLLDSEKKIAQPNNSKEKKNDVKLAVHDLRTHHLFDEDSAKIASDKIVQKAAEKKEINLSMQKQADGNVQMTMELASRAQENITASSSQAAGAQGSDFQAMLSNAVQENAPDFVKAGNIVLKDNNQGSINLILRPEGLGNVKISLNLDDKNLSAQITVQTKEAMDAFRESIPSLKQAFTESGFETGSFDLNFSNNQQNFAQGGNDGQNQQNSGILAHKSYGEFVTASALASGDVADAYAGGDYSVNIVA